MARYTTFGYQDGLAESIHSKLPENLKVTGDGDPELLLIMRLLSGNIEFSHNYTEVSFKSRVNYFSSDLKPFRNWKSSFPKLISEDINATDLESFIVNKKFINRTFYSVILSELSQFLLHTRKKSHTSAFIFLYRVLEKISYAFPMIYASKIPDFKQSYKALTELVSGEGEKRELGFFKTFIYMLYEGDSISETSIDIQFEPTNQKVKEQMYKAVKEVTPNDAIHADTINLEKLSIKFCEMGSFIINIRNRFFHNLNNGSKNIDSNQIVDSDELFKFINPMVMHWIAMVLLAVVSFSISEYLQN